MPERDEFRLGRAVFADSESSLRKHEGMHTSCWCGGAQPVMHHREGDIDLGGQRRRDATQRCQHRKAGNETPLEHSSSPEVPAHRPPPVA